MSKKIMLTAAALLGLAVGWVAWRAIVAPDVPTTIPAAKTPLIAPAPIPEPPVLAPAPLTVKPALATATASSPPKPPAEGAVVRNGNYTVEVDIRDVVGETPVPNLKVVGVWLESVVIMKGALPGSFRVVRHEVSALAGADGRAVLRAEGPAGPLERFEVGNDWHVVRWEREGDPKNPKIDSVDGSTTKIVMWVRRAFRLQGIVVGSDGQPIPGVDINFIVPTQIGADTMMGNQMSRGSHDGRFDLGLFAEDPGVGFPESLRKDLTQGSQITFKKDGYSVTTLDPRSVGRESRDRVTVTLAGGYSLAGVLVDGSGRALANATVAIEFGDEYDRRRGTRTDANGKWRIDRLGSGSAMLVARAFAVDAKARRALTITADDLDVRIVAESIRFSHPPKSTKVMGLELAEVDDDLRSAYDVPEFVHVLILDPGPDADPLGIGRLEKGYGIMVVGEQTVHTLREVVEALLNQTKTPNDSLPGQKRIVYTFWDERSMGTNTQYVRMTEARVSSLKATLETLPK